MMFVSVCASLNERRCTGDKKRMNHVCVAHSTEKIKFLWRLLRLFPLWNMTQTVPKRVWDSLNVCVYTFRSFNIVSYNDLLFLLSWFLSGPGHLHHLLLARHRIPTGQPGLRVRERAQGRGRRRVDELAVNTDWEIKSQWVNICKHPWPGLPLQTRRGLTGQCERVNNKPALSWSFALAPQTCHRKPRTFPCGTMSESDTSPKTINAKCKW